MTMQAASSASLSESSATTGGTPSAPPSTSDVGISLDNPFTGGMRLLAHKWTTQAQARPETATMQESVDSTRETAPEVPRPVPARFPTDLVVGLKKWTGI